jgi:perosamine synthetase
MMLTPVAEPYVSSRSKAYLADAIDDNFISGVAGQYINRFEEAMADFIGVKHAVSCSNGTTALHLMLAAYDIGPGDSVCVPATTNMATFFAVLYCGAKPIPVDISGDTFCIDVDDLERKIDQTTKAILIVHLFGQPCDMVGVKGIAKKHNLLVFEDCAEAHGSEINGRKVGSIGDAGAFSFFANKILSCGEGGIVTTDSVDAAKKMKSLRALNFGEKEKFLHEGVGFNYRLSNLHAALALGQVEEADNLVSLKIKMGETYDDLLRGYDSVKLPVRRPGYKNSYWMYHIDLVGGETPGYRNQVILAMARRGVECRPGFVSYTLQNFCSANDRMLYPCPEAEAKSFSTLYLPSSHMITVAEQRTVAAQLADAIKEASALT